MKNTKRKHLKLCLLLLFMVLGCFAITNVRTTTVQASSRTFKSNGRTYMEKHNDNTLNTVLYQKVSGRYKQVAKSSRYLIYRFSYGKKLYFSSADDEGTGITCTYTKGKNGFKLERSKMVLTERSGRYAVGYICMTVNRLRQKLEIQKTLIKSQIFSVSLETIIWKKMQHLFRYHSLLI